MIERALEIAVHVALLVALPPLLLGVINRVKAVAAGRKGPPLLQAYFDVWKLVRKGAVYSRTTTWLFRAGPVVSVATALAAGLLVPVAAAWAPLSFEGDVILFAYVLAVGRFFTVAAALDTGSAFEGMGGSREATFSALAEPALFLALAAVCVGGGSLSFADVWHPPSWAGFGATQAAVLAAVIVLGAVLLAENARMPIDDPNTHLELTMIHEVMVLDHGGPDLAFILYGSAVKLFVMAALIVRLLVPLPASPTVVGVALFVAGALALAALVGLVESITSRVRLVRVPQFLIGASVLAAMGLLAVLYRRLG